MIRIALAAFLLCSCSTGRESKVMKMERASTKAYRQGVMSEEEYIKSRIRQTSERREGSISDR